MPNNHWLQLIGVSPQEKTQGGVDYVDRLLVIEVEGTIAEFAKVS